MSEIKRILNRCTTKSGCGIATVDAVFPFCLRKILYFLNDGIVPNPINPCEDDYVGILLKEERGNNNNDGGGGQAEEDDDDDDGIDEGDEFNEEFLDNA
jgi:hypothetical protein